MVLIGNFGVLQEFVLFAIGVFIVLWNTETSFRYPKVRRDETVIDDYHGTQIADPYRWLEDPDSEEFKAFIAVENNLTMAYLEGAPFRNEIRDKLTQLWNYPKREVPMKKGNKYFYYANSGLQNQWVLMVQDTLNGTSRVFIDPNTFSADGSVSMRSTSFSKDGSLFAYGLSQSGSDWITVHIKNVSSGENFPEILGHTKWPSIAWTHDNLGFFYTRFPSYNAITNESTNNTRLSNNAKVYYHKVGTNQEEDALIIEFIDKPKLSMSPLVSDDGDYLLLYTYEVIYEEFVCFVPLKDRRSTGIYTKVTPIPINIAPALFTYVANDGSLFYFVTNLDAPNQQLVKIDLNKPEKENWSIVIPEATEALAWVVPVNNDKIFVSYTKDVKSTLELRHLQNGSLIQKFPIEIGSIFGYGRSGKREHHLFFFQLITYKSPGTIYKVDLSADTIQAEVFHQPQTSFDSSSLQVDQVFYSSKDGTKIPMYILHRKDLEKNGNAPAYLHSYGGFYDSQAPVYAPLYLVFVNHFHGVVAIPSIRGGGEYGKDWWDDGRLLKKQNCFDDFAAAAEYLISNNYTNPSKLAIHGRSNGGLLVGATVNQRPELFGAAVPDVGVMDMLRFQLFTGGFLWCGEYGCSENKTHFDNLITYSPLHNIRLPKNESVQYPAILVKTADHDDRVVPSHSFKYIAELQHTIGNSERQTNPLFIRIEENAGHGSQTPASKIIEATVDEFSFFVRTMNYTFFD